MWRTNCSSLKESMQSVIVTITGYKGLERANLIELINRTGAAFTGKWTPRHTHLVCWNYNGPKFDMAKNSGTTTLLNHRWFEDCLNDNCRLPEHPYTLLSGEEVGPLRWAEEATTPNRCLQNRDLDMGQPLEGRQGTGPSAVHGYHAQVELVGGGTAATRRQLEMSSASCSLDAGRLPNTASGDEEPSFLRKRQQGPRTPAPRNNFQRLVRKTNAEHQPTRIDQSSEGVEGNLAERTTGICAFKDPCTPTQASHSPHILELPREQAVVLGSPEYGVLPNGGGDSEWLPPTFEVPVAQQEDRTQALVQPAARSPEAMVACVICYTEMLTEKEGVLGCGHKFCFPCIHRWATDPKSKVPPKCPLCKAPFDKIVKRDWCSSSGDGCANPHEDEEVTVCELPRPTAIVNMRRVLPPTGRAATPKCCISCNGTNNQDLFYVCSLCPRRPRAMHVHCLEPARVLESWFCPPCTLLREQIRSD